MVLRSLLRRARLRWRSCERACNSDLSPGGQHSGGAPGDGQPADSTQHAQQAVRGQPEQEVLRLDQHQLQSGPRVLELMFNDPAFRTEQAFMVLSFDLSGFPFPPHFWLDFNCDSSEAIYLLMCNIIERKLQIKYEMGIFISLALD